MVCPHCSSANLDEAGKCSACGTPFPEGQETIVAPAGHSGWSAPSDHATTHHVPVAALRPGRKLGDRYEILELLGEGGMGAVYKARDHELDRLVALKVIRPELAGRPEVLQRFKQELILARGVTHRNVIRIFDLVVADGLKFITMELVDGSPLSGLLTKRGKYPPMEAAAIVQQVCLGLEAAHAEGVVHRDLKPQNIMVDSQGRLKVMDFGLAGSTEVSMATQTGALLGTPAYMSPEQAQGETADARSDLFSLGIIFYELLTRARPFDAPTLMGTLMKRVQGNAQPPIELDPSIPRPVNDIVAKCLIADRNKRYQSATELREDIEDWLETQPGAGKPHGRRRPAPSTPKWLWLAVVVCCIAVVMSLTELYQQRFRKPAPAQKVVTLLVSDFKNETGDPLFNGTLEPALSLALEGAPFIATYDRADARRVATQLRPGTTLVDEEIARLVAVRQGINAVVAGSIARRENGYAVSTKLVDAVTGKVLTAKEIGISNKEEVLAAVGKLSAPIRRNLGDRTPESAQLAAAETFTSSSLPAAHAYAEAQQLALRGKWDEAVQGYLRAVELEPGLGRAYAGIAVSYANLGQRQDAEKYYQLAMARLDHMTDREKYRTRGGYYLLMRNQRKAIDEFSTLVGQFPADSAGLTDLSLAYFYGREMDRALKEGRQALAIYPNSLLKRINVGLFAMYAGQFKSAEEELGKVLEQNPTYAKALLAMGACQLAQGRAAEAEQSYRKLEGFPNRGPEFAAVGLADLALYEGRVKDAVKTLEQGIAGDLTVKRITAAANKMAVLGSAHALAGKRAEATAVADRAVGTSRQENILYSAARIYLEAGQEAKAVELANELGSRVEPDPRAYGKLILGETRLRHGDAAQAIVLMQESQAVADTWLGRFLLGRAYLEAGKFPEAHSELEVCLKRRGEATALFLDDMPTCRYLPGVHYYFGRVQEALKSGSAAESYRTFLAMKQKDEGDPLVADARRRLEALSR